MKFDDIEQDLINRQPPVSFDFAIFAPVLIQVLVDMLNGCGGDGAARAKNVMSNPSSFWSRYHLRRASKEAAKQTGIEMTGKDLAVTSQCVTDCFAALDDKDSLFEEAEEENIPNHIFM